MKKVYYLSTCDTCNRIMDEIKIPQSFITQDLKTQGITEDEVEELFNLTDSYEALFNKRARLYKDRKLKDKKLLEEDYLNLIIEHYTFLKRPVIVNNDEIFIGNSKKTVEAAKKSIHGDV
ncbi:arsenate reductase family protein [Rasiella sp. SM2506]|uniref:arsenate reductase family protein n=1 Tax=Rasiella sp. SM2506 TaxID=3423914 RepID=UPI003D7A07C0